MYRGLLLSEQANLGDGALVKPTEPVHEQLSRRERIRSLDVKRG